MNLEQEKRLAQGIKLAFAGHYQDALEIFEELVAQDVDDDLLWRKLAYVQSQLSDYAAARDAIERALLLTPENPAHWWMLSSHSLELGLQTDALYAARKMVALCECQNNTYYINMAYFFLAETALRCGFYTEALSACQKLAPDFYSWISGEVRKIADIKSEAEAAIG